VEVHASGVIGDVYVVPHASAGSCERNLRHVSYDRRVVEIPAPVLGKLFELPHEACQALHRHVFRMPLAERSVCKRALHTPRCQGELRDVPFEACEPLRRYVQHLPFAEGGVLKGGLQASRQYVYVYQLPQTPERTFRVEVLDVPQDRCVMGVHAPELEVMLVMPQGTFEPLRNHVLQLSLSIEILGQRDVQPPVGSRWRAHVPQLRLHQVPHERQL